MTYHQHPHTPDWVYIGDRAIGQAKTTVDAAAFVAEFNRLAEPKDGPLKWGCKLHKCADGRYLVVNAAETHFWSSSMRQWFEETGRFRVGCWPHPAVELANFENCSVPPPDYTEPRHPCKECGQEMEFAKGDPGDPQTMANPMGGCPPIPAGWCCECGHFEEDRKERDE